MRVSRFRELFWLAPLLGGIVVAEEWRLGTLLETQDRLRSIPFSEVVREAAGREVVPIDPANPVTKSLLDLLRKVAPQTLAFLNDPEGPARSKRRINEVSALAESFLQEAIPKADPTWIAEIPVNAQGNRQRSGYPDLLLRHRPTGQIIYLDPKLYASDQEASSLRTFYFQPRKETNKILNDGSHLLLGIRHDGEAGKWFFTGWKLVDLAKLTVRLKVEFQASNKALYQQEGILLESE